MQGTNEKMGKGRGRRERRCLSTATFLCLPGLADELVDASIRFPWFVRVPLTSVSPPVDGLLQTVMRVHLLRGLSVSGGGTTFAVRVQSSSRILREGLKSKPSRDNQEIPIPMRKSGQQTVPFHFLAVLWSDFSLFWIGTGNWHTRVLFSIQV